MTIMMSASISLSILLVFLNHPMSMGLILMIQSILISMISGMLFYNFWFSYILFLIMIGGLLILFIYMTSIASNEMFYFSNKLTIMLIMTSVFILMMMMINDQMINEMKLMSLDFSNTENKTIFELSLNKYFNFPSNLIVMFMIIYLFITLIAVVKITNISYGPLRQNL